MPSDHYEMSSRQNDCLVFQLESPLMYDVQLIYPERVVDVSTVTRRKFPQYFNGSEIVVAGKLHDASSQEPWEMMVSISSIKFPV